MSKLFDLCMKNTEDLAEVFNASLSELSEIFDTEDICTIAGIEYVDILDTETEQQYKDRIKGTKLEVFLDFLELSEKDNTEKVLKILEDDKSLMKFLRYVFTYSVVDFPDYCRLVMDYDLTDKQLDLAHEIYDFIKD